MNGTDWKGQQGNPFAAFKSDRRIMGRDSAVQVIPVAKLWDKGSTVQLLPEAEEACKWWIRHGLARNGVRMYLPFAHKGLWRPWRFALEFDGSDGEHFFISNVSQGWTRSGLPVLTSDASGDGLGGWFDSESYTVYFTPELKDKLAAESHIGAWINSR